MAQSRNLLRVMLDAKTLFAGILWPRWPYEVLRHALRRDFDLVLAEQVIIETHRNLARYDKNSSTHLENFLMLTRYQLIPMPSPEEVARNTSLMRDPTDVPIALAAMAARVDVFITQDRDFTDRDASTVELHRRLAILLPGTFLREHMGWNAESLEAIRQRTWRDLS
jgi:predicted nucleic acid-binding protein